jgi:hypothetical protein
MQYNGKLILKYHGEEYSCHELKLPITLEFGGDEGFEMSFEFDFPESPTKEKVVFNRRGNINTNAVMQPYGIEIVIPNENSFLVQFMMVEELPQDGEAEMYTAVAKFDYSFAGDKNSYSIYHF